MTFFRTHLHKLFSVHTPSLRFLAMSFSPAIPLHQPCFVFPSICLVRTYTLMTFRTLSHAMVRITGDIYADVGGSVIDGRHVFELDGCED